MEFPEKTSITPDTLNSLWDLTKEYNIPLSKINEILTE